MNNIRGFGHVEQMLSLAGGVSMPSYKKIWGHKIGSMAHYLCVNPLLCFSFLLREKETWQ